MFCRILQSRGMQHCRAKCTQPDWSTGHSCMCQAQWVGQLLITHGRLAVPFENFSACFKIWALPRATKLQLPGILGPWDACWAPLHQRYSICRKSSWQKSFTCCPSHNVDNCMMSHAESKSCTNYHRPPFQCGLMPQLNEGAGVYVARQCSCGNSCKYMRCGHSSVSLVQSSCRFICCSSKRPEATQCQGRI